LADFRDLVQNERSRWRLEGFPRKCSVLNRTEVFSFGILSFDVEASVTNDTMVSDLPHRINPDGIYESICILCLATVATGRNLEELRARHKDHVCNSVEWANDYLPSCPS
jgi:hypothetical protein